jgi:hypothetical protein
MKNYILLIVALLLVAIAPAGAQSAELVTWEVQAITGYHDGLTAQKLPQLNDIGGSYFQKFAGKSGDWAALNLQYDIAWTGSTVDVPQPLGTSLLTRYNMRPLLFRLHQADFELKRLGAFTTLWVGHNRPAFGLNPVIDTHGTTWHTLVMQNLGVEEDWGVGGNGYLGSTDYRFSVTTHSDMALDDKGALAALRWGFGDPTQTSTFWGVSGEAGFTQSSPWTQDFTPQWESRLGSDFRANWSNFYIYAEAVACTQVHDPVYGGWLRLTDQLIPETLSLSPQYSRLWRAGMASSQAQLELEYKPISWLSLRLGELYNQNMMMDGVDGFTGYLSVYFRR